MRFELIPHNANSVSNAQLVKKTSRQWRLFSPLLAVSLGLAVAPLPMHAQTFTVLYSFGGVKDGSGPSGVIRDAAGNLYGTTQNGGTHSHCNSGTGCGTVFKLDTSGKKTVLYSFTGGKDGYMPFGVIRDSSGTLYGTTEYGGTSNAGVVYKLDSSGKQTTIYSFTGKTDGAYPVATVTRDASGNLYGTTYAGGNSACFCGVVFKVDPAGKETVLYMFTGQADGANPTDSVVRDSAGNLYGTTLNGGNFKNCPDFSGFGCGIVFKVDTTGKETVLHAFTGGPDGEEPYGGVFRDSSGNLYGTTQYGGTSDVGTIFKVTSAGNEQILYTFAGGDDGAFPLAGVVRDTAGNLFGAALQGGRYNFGTVFELDSTGKLIVLHTCSDAGADGEFPVSVTRDSADNLYGTMDDGGGDFEGMVFKIVL